MCLAWGSDGDCDRIVFDKGPVRATQIKNRLLKIKLNFSKC